MPGDESLPKGFEESFLALFRPQIDRTLAFPAT